MQGNRFPGFGHGGPAVGMFGQPQGEQAAVGEQNRQLQQQQMPQQRQAPQLQLPIGMVQGALDLQQGTDGSSSSSTSSDAIISSTSSSST